MEQHEKHVGKRFAFEARHVKKNTMRAFGSIAYATAYGKLAEKAAQIADREECRRLTGHYLGQYRLEWMHPTLGWQTCHDRGMRGANVEECMLLIRGLEDRYRVMTRDAYGNWKRRSAPRATY
jgi:hypothetical protein